MIYDFEKNVPEVHPEAWVAANATLIGKIKLEKNSSIWFNAVLRGDIELITIGENSNIQDGSVLHTDPGFKLNVGKGVTVGHMVMLHGCQIGDDTLIGIGSIVLDRAHIMDQVMLGAGSIVTPNSVLESGWLYLGGPAKAVRKLNTSELEFLQYSALHYVKIMRNYF